MENGRRPEHAAQVALHLRSVRACVRSDDVLADSLLSTLVIEDACWCAAMADWESRRPRPWQRRRIRRWNAEHEHLCQERRRLELLAGYCGLI